MNTRHLKMGKMGQHQSQHQSQKQSQKQIAEKTTGVKQKRVGQ
jgi:hypothetical protein